MTDEQQQYKPAKGQMEIDFTRGRRRKWVEELKLDSYEYVDLKGKTRKVCRTDNVIKLLDVLETHARDGGPCFLKLERLMHRLNLSETVVRKAIRDCVGKGLVEVDTSFDKNKASRYQIVWDEIGQAIMDHPKTLHLIPHPDGSAVRKQASQEPAVEVVTAVNSTGVATEVTPVDSNFTPVDSTVTPVEMNVTPVESTVKNDDDTTYHARAFLNHELNHVRKPKEKPCSSSPVENAASVENSPPKPEPPQTGRQSTERRDLPDDRRSIERPAKGLTPPAPKVDQAEPFVPVPETPNGGWTRPLLLSDFLSRETLCSLWLHALKFRFVDESMRFHFFTLAKYVQRMTIATQVRDPGAYFTAQVIARNWLGDHEDARNARNAIDCLIREGRLKP